MQSSKALAILLLFIFSIIVIFYTMVIRYFGYRIKNKSHRILAIISFSLVYFLSLLLISFFFYLYANK